jgi:immunoglobulin I-set domain protein
MDLKPRPVMWKRCFAVLLGHVLMLIASANGQVSNDCWAVRAGRVERTVLRADEAGLFALKADDDENRYECHYVSTQSPSLGFTCRKFDAGGNKLWESRFAETNGNYTMFCDFAPAPGGALLLVTALATSFGGENVVVTVTRIDSDGNQSWVSQFNSRGFHHRLAVDTAGNVFVTGVNFGASVNQHPVAIKSSPVALTKIDPTGAGLWCTHTNSAWPHETLPYSLTTGPDNDLYAAWSSYHEWTKAEPYYREFVTVRLTAEASERWSRRYHYQIDNLMDPYSLQVDSDGNVFTTGSMVWGAPFDTHFTIKYSADGQEVWLVYWPEDSGVLEHGATAVDRLGNFFVSLAMAWPDPRLVTAKFDPDGNRLWSTYERASERDHFSLLDLKIDAAQSLIVSGVVFALTNDDTRMKITYLQNTTPGVPVVRRQPTDRRVRAGTTLNLEVLATGMEPLAYQWRFNGANISGETNAAFVLDQLEVTDTGFYSVLVTNEAGCALSSEAKITVVEIPPFKLGRPEFRRTVVQEPDGSWTTNEWVHIIMSGGEMGRLYTIEVSTNLVRWQSAYGRGVGPDGSTLFILRRETQASTFYRISTWP